MKQEFETDDLRKFLEAEFSWGLASLVRLPGHTFSLNFKAIRASDGFPFLVKLTPDRPDGVFRQHYDNLTQHLADLEGSRAVRQLFVDGPTVFCGHRVRFLSWCEGERRGADQLTESELSAFLDDYIAFSEAMQRTRAVLSARDGVELRTRALSACRGLWGRWLRRILAQAVPPEDVAHDSSRLQVIHGDFHYGNFLFANGKVSGFFDLEEFRWGYPTEDIVRYFTCSIDRLRWYAQFRRRNLLRAFASSVGRLPYPARDWKVAINGLLLRKICKHVKCGHVGLFRFVNLWCQIAFYGHLRTLAERFARRTGEVRIKVISKFAKRGGDVFRYAPGYAFISDSACRDYDWLVVYDEMKVPERLACPREHTILATCEPVSIKRYSRAYVRQFGHLLTNRPDVDGHPHYHLGRGYYKWFCDRTHPEAVATAIPPKTKLVSAVCSSKQMRHTKHFARFRLVSELAKAVPELEWYGHGVRSFGKKYEVMDPYKYHVVVENHVAPHHWTEKLSDAFLCECLPFYAGAPDLADDFPRESFIPIPIDDPAEAVRIVKTAVANGEYEKRREAVLEAKRLVLEKYNFWAQVIAVIEQARERPVRTAAVGGADVLYPRKALRWRNAAALEDVWFHLKRAFMV